MSNMDDWFRDPSPRSSGSAGSGYPGGGPTENLSYGSPGQSAWPTQPPARTDSPGRRSRPYQGGGSPGGPTAAVAAGGAGCGRAGSWASSGLLVVLILVFTGVMYFYLNSKLTRANVLVDYNGRPVAGAGQNWLITGSDSRQGLTRKEERQLATGRGIGGHRSDTIMVLHIPSNGLPAVLVSIPRDSYVDIPGFGMNKINAAYDFGGPKLLAKTVQNATGL